MNEIRILKKANVFGMTLTVVFDGKGKYPFLTYNSHAGGERSRTEKVAIAKFDRTIRFFEANPEAAKQLAANPIGGDVRRRDG